MSIQAVGWVLDHSASRGFARLVLISLANHANRHGTECHPSLGLIASEAGVGYATAARAIETLERAGEVLVRRGKGRGNPNHYVLTMSRDLVTCEELFDKNPPERIVSAREKRSERIVSTENPPERMDSGENPPERIISDPIKHPETVDKTSAPLRAHVDKQEPSLIEPLTGERERALAPTVPGRIRLTAEHYAFAADLGLDAAGARSETAVLLDHYRSGRRAPPLDVEADWRIWMRRAAEFGARSRASPDNGAASALDPTKYRGDSYLKVRGRRT